MQAIPSDLLARTDILVLNEHELAELAGSAPCADEAMVQAALDQVRRRSGTDIAIVVTLGGNGLIADFGTQRIRLPGLPVSVVDTTGAGDCFTGALGAGLADGLEVEAALIRANRAAAISVTRHGAASSMPRLTELD